MSGSPDRPEAGRDGAAVRSRSETPRGPGAPGQHDCVQPGQCGGILPNWRRAGQVSAADFIYLFIFKRVIGVHELPLSKAEACAVVQNTPDLSLWVCKLILCLFYSCMVYLLLTTNTFIHVFYTHLLILTV